jgi:hypothetical protein
LVFEAMPRKGELSTRDLRSVYGGDLRKMSDVGVLVLDEDQGVPVAACVALAERRWGWSRRKALVCPSCAEHKDALLARAGRLQCTGCHRRLTRQQREKKTADWVRRGGREEDRVLRLLRPAVNPSDARFGEARRLALEIVAADHARLDELQRRVRDLTVYMSMPR